MKSQNDGTPAGAYDRLLILVGIIGTADETGTVQTAHLNSQSSKSSVTTGWGRDPPRFKVERDVRMFANGDRLDRRGGVRTCP